MTRIKLWAAAIGAALVALLGLLAKAKHDGRKQEQAKSKETDRAKADAIRKRVDAVKRPGGVRPDDKRGYRDGS
jgi:hypothetical protein